MITTAKDLIDRLSKMNPDQPILGSVMTIDGVLDSQVVLESYWHWIAAADDHRARCEQVVADLRAAADAAFDRAMDAMIAKELERGEA